MRIVIADDHPIYLEAVRDKIAHSLENAEIRTFTNMADALKFLAGHQADLAILDYSMPGLGCAGLERALEVAGKTPVALMSGVASAKDVSDAIAAGARGFLPKTMEGQVFVTALSVILYGGTYLPVEFSAAALRVPLAAGSGNTPEPDDFSAQEIELMRLIAAGASNKEIALRLDLLEPSVKLYLTRLFRRLGVKNRSQAAVAAIKLGLTPAVEE